MSNLLRITIAKTIREMLTLGQEIEWIKEEIEEMFYLKLSDKEWENLFIQSLLITSKD